jgi:1,4-dihydroxy-2-naphthoate octaprenyltransferase
VNEIPARAGDGAVGKRTLPVRWSPERVVRAYGAGVITAYALIAIAAAAGITPVWTLIALVTAPLAQSVHQGLARNYERPYDLMPAMQSNIALHLVTGLLLLVGYIVDLLLN